MILVIPSHPKPEKDFAQVRQNGISYKTQFMVESFRMIWIRLRSIQVRWRASEAWLRSLYSAEKVILVWEARIRSLKVKLSNFENAELPDLMNSKIIQTKYQNSGSYRSSQKCPASLVCNLATEKFCHQRCHLYMK